MTATAAVGELDPSTGAGRAAGAAPGSDQATTDRQRRSGLIALFLLAYVASSLIAFLPVGPFDTSRLPNALAGSPAGSDPYQMLWFLEWFPYAVSHGLNIFQTNLIEYPHGVNLADNTTVPLLGFIAWPVTATLGPVAAFNFLIHLSFVASAASMFFVLRRWCTTLLAPFVGGLLYAFGPYTAAQELHIDLIFVPIPPILAWCADELVRRQKMNPGKLGLLIGLASFAELLVSPDVLAGCVVLAGGAGIALGIRFRHVLRDRSGYVLRGAAAASLTFGALAGYQLWQMVAGPRHLTGPVIPPAALQIDRADLLGPMIPTSNQLLSPHFISKFGDYFVAGNLSESGTYLGLPLLIILVIIIRRLRRDPTIKAFAWLSGAAFLVSLGSKLTLGTLTTVIPLPEVIFAHLPLLDNTIPARYALYVLLFTSMILAIGVERLWLKPAAWPEGTPRNETGWARRIATAGGSSPHARHVRIGAVAAITTLFLLPAIPFPDKGFPWPRGLPSTVGRLVPPGSVVLTYPFVTPLHPAGMVWQALDQLNYHLLGGYANIQVGHAGQRWPALLSPPYPEALLGYSSFGDRLPDPLPVVPADYEALRIFLAKYHVGAIVYWAGGDNRTEVYNYLRASIGPPYLREYHFAIWLPVAGHWASPRRDG
jgi:hypothetical protein